MNFADVIKKSVLEGFSYTDITTTKIMVTLVVAYILAMYIHLVYKFVTKNAFYYKNYGISMTIMAVVTADIILAMQSSLVISLGMVGALSIVRFRTAIKDPLDLLFLFWSISIGIICGAGLYELAIMTCIAATFGIMIFHYLPVKKSTYLLVINASTKDAFEPIIQILQGGAVSYTVKAKNLSRAGMELIIEVKLKENNESIVDTLLGTPDVEAVHLLENDADVKA